MGSVSSNLPAGSLKWKQLPKAWEKTREKRKVDRLLRGRC